MAETLEWLTIMLAERPTALVAVTGSSHLTGEVLPIADIARLAHAAGARLFVDATHLAGCRRISLTASGVDYLAFSGHTLATPFPTGVLVGRADWLGAERLGDAPHVLGPAALATACRAIEELPDEVVARHQARCCAGCWTSSPASPRSTCTAAGRTAPTGWAPSASGSTATTVVGSPPTCRPSMASAFARTSSRAHPLMGPRSSVPTAVRVSFGLGTSSDDIDRLAAGLQQLLTHGPRWTYRMIDGRWEPVPDPRTTTWAMPELTRDELGLTRETAPLV